MASHQRVNLSLFEKVFLVLGLCQTLFISIINTISIYNICRKAGWPLRRTVAISFLRSQNLSLRQRRYLLPTTGATIQSFCQNHHLTHSSVEIKCDPVPSATLHTIELSRSHTQQDNRLSILYFHGGGFTNPITDGHLGYTVECAQSASVCRIYVLEYGLAPEVKYPGPLVQATATLRHLLSRHGPGDLILGGDSAGGNIILTLLAHIRRPSPYAPALDDIMQQQEGGTFRAVYLLSPAVSLSCQYQSYIDYDGFDFVTRQKFEEFVGFWQPKAGEVWGELICETAQFWEGLPVDKLLITVGSWETLRDQNLEMAKKLQLGNDHVELFVAEREIHVQSVVDFSIGLPSTGSRTKVVSWLSTV